MKHNRHIIQRKLVTWISKFECYSIGPEWYVLQSQNKYSTSMT